MKSRIRGPDLEGRERAEEDVGNVQYKLEAAEVVANQMLLIGRYN